MEEKRILLLRNLHYVLTKNWVPILLDGKEIIELPTTKKLEDAIREVITTGDVTRLNIGISYGPQSGISGFHIPEKALDTWAKVIQKYGEPNTYKLNLGKTLIYLFKYIDHSLSLKSENGIIYATNVGYCPCPTSINPDNGYPAILDNETDPTQPPPWLINVMFL